MVKVIQDVLSKRTKDDSFYISARSSYLVVKDFKAF